MMLLQHCRIMGCEIDTDCYNQSYISVEETLLRQALNEDSDITGLEEAVEAAKLFVKAIDVIDARSRKMIWETSLGLSTTQSLPSNITYIFSKCWENWSLFNMEKGVPLSRWSAKQLARFHSTDSDTFLPVGCSATEVLIKTEDNAPGGRF